VLGFRDFNARMFQPGGFHRPLAAKHREWDTKSLRPTGMSSPAYKDWADYTVFEDGLVIGRMYEDRHSRPELRWFWSITVYVDPKRSIITSGRAASLDEAKAQFLSNWQRCRAESTMPFQRGHN
jgi:hypothetical protein